MGSFNKFSILNIINTTSRSINIDTNKKKIWDTVNKERAHQFNVGYMTHNFMNKHRTHIEQVIKTFQFKFKLVTLQCIKNSYKNIYICYFIDHVL